MAKYEVNGQVYDFPDDMSEDEVLNVISSQGQTTDTTGASTEAPTSSNTPSQDTPEYGGLFAPVTPQYEDTTIYQNTDPMGASLGTSYEMDSQTEVRIPPNELSQSSDWLTASRLLYDGSHSEPFAGTDQELADFGLTTIRWFDNNLVSASIDANGLASKSYEERQAFLYLMDTYEHVDYSAAGFGEGAYAQALDATNWVGLATIIPSLGTSAATLTAGRIATKEGLKALLKTGLVTGLETGLVSGVQDVTRQSVEISGERRDSIDKGQVAGAAGTGFLAGAILGPVADVGLTSLFTKEGLGLTRKAVDGKVDPKATQVPNAPTQAPQAVKIDDNIVGPAKPDESFVGPQKTFSETTTPTSDIQQASPVNNSEPTVSTPSTNNVEQVVDKGMSTNANYSVSDVIAAVKDVSTGIGERLGPERIALVSRQVSDILQSVGVRNTEDLSSTLLTFGFDRDQISVLTNAAKDAYQKIGLTVTDLIKQERATVDPQIKADINSQLSEFNILQEEMRKLELPLSSDLGTGLNQRAGGVFVGDNRGLSPGSILREQGLNPESATVEQLTKAQDEFVSRVDQRTEQVQNNVEIRNLETRIVEAYDNGNITGAVAISAEKEALETVLKEKAAESQGLLSRGFKFFNESVLTRVNTYIISTVLAPSSAIINTIPAGIKLFYKPMLNYIVKGPADQAAFREMLATYSTMRTMQGVAFKAASMSFKYERSMLTGDVSALLEMKPAIDGLHGRIIRTIPRVLQATDSYFEQLIYRSYVAGNATFDAVKSGQKKGLKGKALDDHIAKAVDSASKKAFSDSVDKVGVIDFLRQQGVSRGYKGEALVNWMKIQLDKDASLFKKATDEAGVKYANDMLFKREFSGNNTILGVNVSRGAKNYEAFVNKNPIMRIMGQLFFRTPVRVLEESVRLTPGLNLIHPTFIDDLKAPLGSARQVRAHGEAMLGFGAMMGVLTLYSTTSITGGGTSDYKQRRGKENGKDFEPYTITFSDGSTFNYRNFDPFATPIKIMVNALDRYQEVQYRKSQGEYVDHIEKEVLAYMGVATGAVGQAIRDANLTEGIGQIIDLFAAFGDPEMNENKFTKLLGQKAQLLVPRVVQQYMTMDNPVLNDPLTVEQFFRARINPGDPLVPKQYDSLGNVRTITNPASSMTGINITSKETRDASIDPKTAAVNQELSRIEKASDTSFMAPYKRSEIGVDLRSTLTKDGKESLYDRWQHYYNATGVTDVLYDALVTNTNGSYGNASNDGVRTLIARKIIGEFRNAAFYQMLAEDSGVEEMYLKKLMNKSNALSGE